MEINPEYMVNSLVNQVAELSLKNAQKDAMITQLNEELDSLRKEQIKEMDKDA